MEQNTRGFHAESSLPSDYGQGLGDAPDALPSFHRALLPMRLHTESLSSFGIVGHALPAAADSLGAPEREEDAGRISSAERRLPPAYRSEWNGSEA